MRRLSAQRRQAVSAIVTALLVACGALAMSPDEAHAATVRASLTTIERQVMCVTCKIPLNVAQSPQANRERAYIQGLIDRGEDEAQIKRALVSQYGPTVLGLPSTHGFDLAAYLVPAAVVIGLLLLLIALLPRWRARARKQAPDGAEPRLSDTDAARLESDLARFD